MRTREKKRKNLEKNFQLFLFKRYDCVHSLTTSDHHPVYASLTIDTKLPNPLTNRSNKAYLEFTDLTVKKKLWLLSPSFFLSLTSNFFFLSSFFKGADLPFVALDRDPPFLTFYSNIAQSGKLSKRSVIRGSAPKWLDASVPRLKCLVRRGMLLLFFFFF